MLSPRDLDPNHANLDLDVYFATLNVRGKIITLNTSYAIYLDKM